jgi:glutaredoxin
MVQQINTILLKQEDGRKLYNVVGGNYCTRCKLVKNHLDSIGIAYNYIDYESEQGKQIIADRNIEELPYIYDNTVEYAIGDILAL